MFRLWFGVLKMYQKWFYSVLSIYSEYFPIVSCVWSYKDLSFCGLLVRPRVLMLLFV